MRLVDSLAAMESGSNAEHEQHFIINHPPSLSGLVTEPTIVLGTGGTIALWYLPGALAQPTQV